MLRWKDQNKTPDKPVNAIWRDKSKNTGEKEET